MTAADPYLRMALNNAWANETLFAALGLLSPAAFVAPRPGFFPSLCLTLNHVLEVDRYYLAALEGRPVAYDEIAAPAIEEAETLGRAQRGADLRLITLCRELTAADLAGSRMTLRGEGPMPERLDALLLHLFQHQVHHRGQAHVQLQAAGVAPPQLDDFHLVFGRVPSAQAWLDGFDSPAE